MSATSKNLKTFLVSSYKASFKAHYAQLAKKTSETSRNTRKSNPQLNTVLDQHNILSKEIVIAEDNTKKKTKKKLN